MDYNKLGLDAALVEATKSILEKKLHPNQEKLDKNKNGKLDSQDFKILRGESKCEDEEDELEEGKCKKEEVDLDEATEYSHSQLMKKFKDGTHEALQDVKPGKHVEIRNTSTGKRITVFVKPNSVKEDVEQIDELSKGTLKSYASKAFQQAGDLTYDAAHTKDKEEKQALKAKAAKRAAGVEKADKLTKEQMEEIEALAAKHGLVGE